MKRLALALALASCAALLSGCIIVPSRHGGYYGDRDHGRYHDRGYGDGGYGERGGYGNGGYGPRR